MLSGLSMKVMNYLLPVLLSFALAAAQSLPERKTPKAPARTAKTTATTHPNLGDGACVDCHRHSNADVVADYEASKHGRGLVSCIACHGSVSANFTAKPDSTRCVACHATMVDTLKTPVMKGKNCWSCHVPHRLNPHIALFKNDPGASK